jgi:hypothetical protein
MEHLSFKDFPDDVTGHIIIVDKKFDEKWFNWPIPLSEKDVDKILIQNPRYKVNKIAFTRKCL